jgi:hypothetical protein
MAGSEEYTLTRTGSAFVTLLTADRTKSQPLSRHLVTRYSIFSCPTTLQIINPRFDDTTEESTFQLIAAQKKIRNFADVVPCNRFMKK